MLKYENTVERIEVSDSNDVNTTTISFKILLSNLIFSKILLTTYYFSLFYPSFDEFKDPLMSVQEQFLIFEVIENS